MNNFQLEWVLRVLASVVFAAFIGNERHKSYKEAGVRTHVLVALASCLLMLVSKYGFPDVERVDASRIAAGVVSGISFIGAGIIFENRGKIEGLTTAAGIWATCALGLTFGAGMYLIGAICGVLIYLVVAVSPDYISNHQPLNMMTIVVHLDKYGTAATVNDCLEKLHLIHSENTLSSDQEGGWYLETEIHTHDDIDACQMIDEFLKTEHVLGIEIK